jgi:hypothetical protein
MDAQDLLEDSFTRIRDLYADHAEGLDDHTLHHRPDGAGNSVGWLLWHLARVQDDHVAHLAGSPQRWEQWQERFGLPNGPDDIGFGHTSEQVDALRITDPALLVGYHADVDALTRDYLTRVDAAELDRVVDRRWDPPVTAGARLVSIQGDCLQHLGQVGYVKGLLTT